MFTSRNTPPSHYKNMNGLQVLLYEQTLRMQTKLWPSYEANIQNELQNATRLNHAGVAVTNTVENSQVSSQLFVWI